MWDGSDAQQQELALPGADHALEVFMLGAFDRDVTAHELVAQVTRNGVALFHLRQRVFDGDRQAQVAAFVGAAFDGGTRFDAFDHADVATQQARGDRQIRVGIGARQAVFHAHGFRPGGRHTQADGAVFFAPLDVDRCRSVRQEAAERVHVRREHRQDFRDVLLQAADVMAEQLAHCAVGIGEDRLAGGDLHHALVQVHGAAGFVTNRLGHERGSDVVLERRFAQGAFEHGDLVGQIQCVAVPEVDFHLRRAVFMDQRVQIQTLQLAPVVDVFEQRIEFVGGINRERLPPAFSTARTAQRRLEWQVRVFAALGQVELHFRRHDRLPALVGVQLQDFLQHVARRQFDRVAELVEGVVDDDGGRLDRPWNHIYGVAHRFADHVDVGRVEQVVVDVVVDKIPGYRLQQHTFRQAHASLMQELVGRCDLAAGNAGQVADHTFNFGNLVIFQPREQLIERGIHKDLVIGFIDAGEGGFHLPPLPLWRVDDYLGRALPFHLSTLSSTKAHQKSAQGLP
ncbi:hypothetical protein EMIT093MI4_50251 [Pseudomonas sp. IT-93MI4]